MSKVIGGERCQTSQPNVLSGQQPNYMKSIRNIVLFWKAYLFSQLWEDFSQGKPVRIHYKFIALTWFNLSKKYSPRGVKVGG